MESTCPQVPDQKEKGLITFAPEYVSVSKTIRIRGLYQQLSHNGEVTQNKKHPLETYMFARGFWIHKSPTLFVSDRK
jgi:hypothetical protein